MRSEKDEPTSNPNKSEPETEPARKDAAVAERGKDERQEYAKDEKEESDRQRTEDMRGGQVEVDKDERRHNERGEDQG